MPPHALLSSERTDWQTPRPFLDLVRAVRPIIADVASAPDNPTRALIFGCRDVPLGTFVNGGHCAGDGLTRGWQACVRSAPGLAFWNPPYGAHLSGPVEPDYKIMRKRKPGEPFQLGIVPGSKDDRICVGVGRGWGAKYAAEARAGLESIALVPVRTDAEWWNVMADASDSILLWRSPTLGARISFVDPLTGKAVQGSNLASTVFYSGPEPEKFRHVFASHGRLI